MTTPQPTLDALLKTGESLPISERLLALEKKSILLDHTLSNLMRAMTNREIQSLDEWLADKRT